MSGQLCLDLLEAPPPARADRLFFALVPDALTGRRIHRFAAGLRAGLGLDGALIPPERLHVSLFGLGDHADLPADLVATAAAAASRVTEVAFDVAFDRIASFGGGRAVVLTAADNLPEIRRFHESLGFAMEGTPLAAHAEAAARRPLNPHMTLLYCDGPIETRAVPPISWRVRDFVLVHSRLGQGRHVHLGRWRLR
jgi:2'-5' RNA ligase